MAVYEGRIKKLEVKNNNISTKVFDIKERTLNFGVSIIKLTNRFPKGTALFVIAQQIIAAGTSIGANVAEGSAASSKKDFINFYNHSLKSTIETIFWLKIIIKAGLLTEVIVEPYIIEAEEISKILGSILLKARGKK